MGIRMTETGVVNARFQIPHLKHIEYVLAAKMRCRKLYIGITNPDPSCVRESVNDEIRSTPEANPLTYLERFEMIKASMEEFGVPRSDYEIVPFPIHRPEYITQYTPADAVYYLGICDGWDEEKLKILKGLGLETEVLWRRRVRRHRHLDPKLHRHRRGVGTPGSPVRVPVHPGARGRQADKKFIAAVITVIADVTLFKSVTSAIAFFR